MPYLARKVRVKCAALRNPQRAAISAIAGWLSLALRQPPGSPQSEKPFGRDAGLTG
jgi:hypothetical protein